MGLLSQRRMDSQVFFAAQNGNISEIEKVYTEKPELLRGVTFNKSNVLHIAAREGHSDFVRWIADHVVEDFSSMCVARNCDGSTPLHEAAYAGDADLVRIFISHFPRVARADLDRIFKSAFYKPFRVFYVVGILVSFFESLRLEQMVNRFGQTPLLIACKCGQVDAATALLEKSAPGDLQSPNYQPCLHLAAYGGHLGIVRLLLKENNMTRFRRVWMRRDAQGATPLHAAIYGGHIDTVREILNPVLSSDWKNWLMTEPDSKGNFAIHAAILKGNDGIVDCLISSMPDCIEIRNADGNTPLHLAVQNGEDPQLVERLLSARVNVHAVNNKGLNPLDITRAEASKKSIKDIISILEEKGASASYTQEFMEKKTFLSGQNEVKENEVMNVETLVASLVATVTFAAIFQIPGGIQDDKNSLQYQVAQLAFQPSFLYFLFFDTLALFTSLFVVISWILCKRLRRGNAKFKPIIMSLTGPLLGISIVSTAMAFVNAASLVTIPVNVKGLRSTNKEAFHKYQTLILLVFLASMTPVTFMMYLYSFMGSDMFFNSQLAKRWWNMKIPIFSLFDLLVWMCYFFMGFQLYQTITQL